MIESLSRPASILYVLLVAVLGPLLFVAVALSIKLYQHGKTVTAVAVDEKPSGLGERPK